MKRAYLYDKSFKVNINCNITRFELKLQSNFFNRHSFIQGVLKKELDAILGQKLTIDRATPVVLVCMRFSGLSYTCEYC